VIADNQLALGAGWDEEMLRVELRMLQAEDYELDLIGFGESELAELLANDADYAGHADEDALPEAPEVAISMPGDLWILSDHRIYCGDATQMESIEEVIGGGLADMVFCDPPYSVAYGSSAPTKRERERHKRRPWRRGIRRIVAKGLRQLPLGHQGSRLHLHELVRTSHTAESVYRGRRALVNVRDLGEGSVHARAL
jgi:hypothetical protein